MAARSCSRLKWFDVGVEQPADAPPALKNSILIGIAATVIALTLGTLASFAMARARFFGRDTISFALVLPIAFPGIVTALGAVARWSTRCPA